MVMKIVSFTAVILCTVSTAFGTSPYEFLDIPVGARATGMGGAFTAVANDPSSVYWNPAGWLGSPAREVAMEYTHYIQGMKKGYIGYLHPMGDYSSFGGGITYLSVGEMTKTTADGDEIGTFAPLYMATTLAYSTQVLTDPSVRAGGGLKWIYGLIDEYSSHAVALDLGALYEPGPRGLVVGFSVQNLGTQIKKYDETKESIPLGLAVGGSYLSGGGGLLLTFDLKRPADHGLIFALGSEWVATKNFTFRLGYNSLGSDWKSGSESDILGGLSVGAGFTWRQLRLDMSLRPMVDLGNPLWISTSYRLSR